MASFLRRGLGRVGASGTTTGLPLLTSFATLASDTITAGGASGGPGSGFVIVTGTFMLDEGVANTLTDSNRIELQITDGTSTSNVNSETLYRTTISGGRATASVSKTWVFSIPAGTDRTYSLQARHASGPDVGAITADNRHITVLYVPFGSAGTATLGAQGEPAVTTSSSGGPDSK